MNKKTPTYIKFPAIYKEKNKQFWDAIKIIEDFTMESHLLPISFIEIVNKAKKYLNDLSGKDHFLFDSINVKSEFCAYWANTLPLTPCKYCKHRWRGNDWNCGKIKIFD